MNTNRFTFLCTPEERQDLQKLAEYHHRSKGDLVRLLIRTAIQTMNQSIDSKNPIMKESNNDQQ
jgi:hypothetical protein